MRINRVALQDYKFLAQKARPLSSQRIDGRTTFINRSVRTESDHNGANGQQKVNFVMVKIKCASAFGFEGQMRGTGRTHLFLYWL